MIAYLRSLAFYIGLTPVTVIFSVIGLLALPFDRKTRYRVITQWTRCAIWWLKITCGLSWRVHGKENIPEQASVILCKHQSAWETMALQLIFPPQCQVLKKELFWVPFFGWGLWCLNPIAIDRSATTQALRKVLREGKERIAQGWFILLFPEGTRMPSGQRGKYLQSGAALAISAQCPIVPVAHNAGVFWPRNTVRKRPGCIDVVIGPPVDSTTGNAAELTDVVENWIEKEASRLLSAVLK